jgi:branched-chain amino acid transport system permease protein
MIATVGLAVFTGFTGLFSLGHAAFFAIGAYTAAILTYFYGFNFYVALALGGCAGGLVGFLIGYPTLKAKLRTDYFAIATLGFGEAIRVLLENLPITQGARGLPGIRGETNLPVLLVCTTLVIWMAWNLIHSRHGRACIAIREDFVAAEMMGVNIFIGRLRSLVFSAFCTALAGGLFAHYYCFIQPSMFTATMSTQMTAMVVAGGMGSISGPAITAMIFIGIPEALRVGGIWRLVAYGLMLVLIMIFRPQGLMGYRELSVDMVKGWYRRIWKGGRA